MGTTRKTCMYIERGTFLRMCAKSKQISCFKVPTWMNDKQGSW